MQAVFPDRAASKMQILLILSYPRYWQWRISFPRLKQHDLFVGKFAYVMPANTGPY